MYQNVTYIQNLKTVTSPYGHFKNQIQDNVLSSVKWYRREDSIFTKCNLWNYSVVIHYYKLNNFSSTSGGRNPRGSPENSGSHRKSHRQAQGERARARSPRHPRSLMPPWELPSGPGAESHLGSLGRFPSLHCSRLFCLTKHYQCC